MRNAMVILVALFALCIFSVGCGGFGEVCDNCSDNSDCNEGLSCAAFDYGTTHLCAYPETRSCLIGGY